MQNKKDPEGVDKLFRSIKVVGGIVAIGLVVAGYVRQGSEADYMSAIAPVLLILILLVLPVAGIRALANQPGSSYKKVFLRIGLFFAIPILMTVIFVILGYIFHAPGINPR